jgi:uncharacterized protein YecT (DUF1311 family)
MKIQFFLVIVAATFAFAQKDENPIAAPAQSESSKHHATADAVCGEANTQMEINLCLAAAYQTADKELNELYSNIMKKQDPPDRDHLQAAQRAWIKYRDANCEAAAELYQGGSIQPSVRAECLRRNTRARADELRQIYDPGSR